MPAPEHTLLSPWAVASPGAGSVGFSTEMTCGAANGSGQAELCVLHVSVRLGPWGGDDSPSWSQPHRACSSLASGTDGRKMPAIFNQTFEGDDLNCFDNTLGSWGSF